MRALVVLAFALAPSLAFAQDGLRARARLVQPDAGGAEVGRPLVVEIEARHAPGGVAVLPERLELPNALGERRRARTHTRRQEGEVEIDAYRVELVPFSAGLIEIPPLSLSVGSTTAETEPILVDVASSLDEAEQQIASSTAPENLAALENMAAGDPPPAAVGVADHRPALALVALAALALIAVLAKKLLARRRAFESQPAPPPPPRPAHELALEELAALEREGLVEAGAYNAFFTRLSFVVRRYLGSRYGIDALERTLDELSEVLERCSTPGLDRRDLYARLFEAERVKFAKYTPSPDEAQDALGWARDLVTRTRADAEASPPRREEAAS